MHKLNRLCAGLVIVSSFLGIAFAAAGEDSKLAAGDTCFVSVDNAPVQLGDRVIAKLPKGERITALKVQGAWVGVEVRVGGENQRGWIHKKFLQSEPPSSPAAAPKEEEPDPKPTIPVPSASSAKARPGEWHQWRGPNRENKSLETGLLARWPPGGPKLLWTARGCGAGFASVIVADGLIYTAGDKGQNCMIIALDLDGQLKWETPNGAALPGGTGGSHGTPTFDNGKIYHENCHGDVVCLDAKTGQQNWTVNILRKFGGRNIGWALSESVLVDGDNVICTPGGPDASIVALNKHTGETVWTSKGLSDPAAYASPIVFELDGLRQICTFTARGVVGVNAKTGEFLWRYDRPANGTANCATPIYANGFVFAASAYDRGGGQARITVRGNKASATQTWETRDMMNHHGDMVLVGGYIYGNHGNGWSCLDFKTGKLMYYDNGIGKGSVTYADGMLYCYNEGGGVALVRATPQQHEIVGRFQIPRGGSGPTWAHPVVCGGRLYLRHGDCLFAYDIKSN